MADRKNNFGGAADSARGAESSVDHEGVALGIIRSGHTPAQKISQITNHPTMPTAMKNWALETVTKIHGGGGVVSPATSPLRPAISGGAPSPAKQASSNSPSILDFHYSNRPEQRGQRPYRPHSETDYDGNQAKLSVKQVTENKTADLAAEEFDKIQKAKSISKPVSAGRRGSSRPSNKTRGVEAGRPSIDAREFSGRLEGAHALLKGAVNRIGQEDMGPVHQKAIEFATDQLSRASASIASGHSARRGVKEGNRVINSLPEANKHYTKALTHLTTAHDMLNSEDISAEAQRRNVSYELPTSELKELRGHSKTLNVMKPGRRDKVFKVGKVRIPTKDLTDPNSPYTTTQKVIGKEDTAAPATAEPMSLLEKMEAVGGSQHIAVVGAKQALTPYKRTSKYVMKTSNKSRPVKESDMENPRNRETNPEGARPGRTAEGNLERKPTSKVVRPGFSGGKPFAGTTPTFEGAPEGKPARRKRGQ
jgi:hypothetical protein